MICLGLKGPAEVRLHRATIFTKCRSSTFQEEASPGLAPEPLLQDAPIPGDDDDESEQPTIAADNTITHYSNL